MPGSRFGAEGQRIEGALINLHWGFLPLDPASMRNAAQERVKSQVK